MSDAPKRYFWADTSGPMGFEDAVEEAANAEISEIEHDHQRELDQLRADLAALRGRVDRLQSERDQARELLKEIASETDLLGGFSRTVVINRGAYEDWQARIAALIADAPP